MMKLGLCCGGGLCCALLVGVLGLGGTGVIFGETTEVVAKKTEVAAKKTVGCTKAGCTKVGCEAHGTAAAPCGTLSADAASGELTADEQKVVTFLADMIEAGEEPNISQEELEQQVGLSKEDVEQLVESKLRAAVMAELSRRNFDLASLGGNCSKFSACSVDRNLMNATGEELARYKEEVALDGTSFSGRIAPNFTLPNTKGQQVSLSEHRGRNVAVVLLSAHCYHSLDTLPILAELRQKYDQELVILPVFINSGNVEDVAARAWELDVEYPLIVSEGKEISELYDSRMVPSTFLIDEQGYLTKKFVGFKDKAVLDQAFAELVGS